MSEPARGRMILRRLSPSAASATEAAHLLASKRGVAVLDEHPNAMLVEGESDLIEAALRELEGWRAFPSRSIPIPDTRPRILKPPSR